MHTDDPSCDADLSTLEALVRIQELAEERHVVQFNMPDNIRRETAKLKA